MLPIILAIQDENDRNFVEELYEKYKDRIYYRAKKLLKNESDLEECVQDVVIAIIQKVEKLRGCDEDHIKNYLMKCTKNIATEKYNDNAKRYRNEISISEVQPEKDMDIPDLNEFMEQLIISEEAVRSIAKILDEMDPLYGDILYFKSFMRMKNTEIAKMLNIPVNTVNQRIFRARNILIKKESERINELLRK